MNEIIDNFDKNKNYIRIKNNRCNDISVFETIFLYGVKGTIFDLCDLNHNVLLSLKN